MMFCAKVDNHTVEVNNDSVIISKLDELETLNGWIPAKELTAGMKFIISDSDTANNETATISDITQLASGDFNITYTI